ncbi:uncharacterized protein [Procambarus clarkii]|uniref:uncharacterized protein n=1 Tax=Procambarus clarkii TaxID=6728 RepID=UPI0037429F60
MTSIWPVNDQCMAEPVNTAKKQKIETSPQSSFGQNPQGTNSPGARTSTNLKRRSGQKSKISSDKSDVILEKLLEEKNWDKIKMFLEICPSLSQHWVTIIGNLALDEGQMDVVKICFLKMGEGESLDEPHNQE